MNKFLKGRYIDPDKLLPQVFYLCDSEAYIQQSLDEILDDVKGDKKISSVTLKKINQNQFQVLFNYDGPTI